MRYEHKTHMKTLIVQYALPLILILGAGCAKKDVDQLNKSQQAAADSVSLIAEGLPVSDETKTKFRQEMLPELYNNYIDFVKYANKRFNDCLIDDWELNASERSSIKLNIEAAQDNLTKFKEAYNAVLKTAPAQGSVLESLGESPRKAEYDNASFPKDLENLLRLIDKPAQLQKYLQEKEGLYVKVE